MTKTTEIAAAFKIADPAISPAGQIVVTTNYPSLRSDLAKKLEKYKDMQLTEDNIALVELVKKEIAATRIAVDKTVKEYLATKLELPVNMLKAQRKDMLDYIDSVETHIDALLEQYDQTRINQLNFVYDEYKKEACEKRQLNPDKTGIILGKEFYLKGAKSNQKELKQKIFEMVDGIYNEKQKHDNDVKIISVACGSDCDPAPYIRQLEFRDVSAILLEISDDSNARNAKEQETEAETESIHVKKSGTKSAPEMVTKTISMTYPKELGTVITAFFKANGVAVRFLK